MSVALCMLFSCSTTSTWHSPEPCSAVSAFAPFYIQQFKLNSETILLTSLTKTLSAQPQSQTAYSCLPNYQPWFIIYLDWWCLRPNAVLQQPFLARLAPIFGSVGFRMRFVFQLQRTVNALSGHYGPSVYYALCRFAKCFSHLDTLSSRLTLNVFQVRPCRQLISYTVHSTSIFSLQTSHTCSFRACLDSLSLSVRFNELIVHATSAVRCGFFKFISSLSSCLGRHVCWFGCKLSCPRLSANLSYCLWLDPPFCRFHGRSLGFSRELLAAYRPLPFPPYSSLIRMVFRSNNRRNEVNVLW